MSWLDEQTNRTFAWVRAGAVIVAMGGVAALAGREWVAGAAALVGAGALWWGAR